MENSDIGAALRDAMYNYQKLKMMDIASDRGLQYLQNRNRNKMDEELAALSIIEKKRALGLPETSDDYERAVNDDKNFYSMLAPSIGKRGLQAIPGPTLLGRKIQPAVKAADSVAITAGDLLPFLKAFQNFGGSTHGRVGRLARAFSL